jgi:hypothetical protein
MFKWLSQSFFAALTAMVFIYIIKSVSVKYNVPVLKNVSEGI